MRLLSAIALGCLLLAFPSEDKTAAKQPINPVKAETKAADTIPTIEHQNNIVNPFTAMLP